MQKLLVGLATLAIFLLAATRSPAQSDEQRPFTVGGAVKIPAPVVPGMMDAMRKDPAFQRIFGNKAPSDTDLVASLAFLNDAEQQIFVVVGRLGLPGVAPDSVPFWIVRRNANDFETMLNLGGQELEIKDNRTLGYHDLELRSLAPSGGKFVISFKYDAERINYVSAGGRIQR